MLRNHEDGSIIYLDEVGHTATMRARYGKSVRGINPNYVVSGLRSRNISVCQKTGYWHI